MHKNTILFVIIAAFAGFVGGFWLANSINRSAANTAISQKPPANSNSNSLQTKGEPDLTDDELKAKIAEADKNPDNFAFQKELGIPAVVCGPGNIAVAHKPDEYVSEEQMGLCDAMLDKLVERLST